MLDNIKVKKVEKQDFEARGLVWPLTVDSGMLLRIPEKSGVFS